MKAKHIALILSFVLIFLNTLVGVVLEGYPIESCLLVDLSLLISAGLLYNLFLSDIADGFKISVMLILLASGLFRMICMAIIGLKISNVTILLAVFFLLVEITSLVVASYMSKK